MASRPLADRVLAHRPATKTKRGKRRKLTTLELCAGAGGAALGLEQADFEHQALVDVDRHACATLRTNRPYWNVIEADIRRFDAGYWNGVDLLSGGLPCPPFSIAGKQLGAKDDRDMFPSMLRIVKEVQPRAVMIENVRGIYAARFKRFRNQIDAAFDAMGFDTHWQMFDAAEFGVPQVRVRVFLVALRRGATKPFEWPKPLKSPPPTVGDAIGDLMAAGGWPGAAAWAKQASGPAPTIVGGSHKHGGADLGPTRARREWAAYGVEGVSLANEPPGADFTGTPRLTIPMVARLQSFPDDWRFAGGKTQSYRQVGNALPVDLAFRVAKAVRSCLE